MYTVSQIHEKSSITASDRYSTITTKYHITRGSAWVAFEEPGCIIITNSKIIR